MSENAKRAQVLWTLVLGLLALLGAATGRLPNLRNLLPEPVTDPLPDDSPNPGEDPTGEPTAPPDESPEPGPGPSPTPAPGGDPEQSPEPAPEPAPGPDPIDGPGIDRPSDDGGASTPELPSPIGDALEDYPTPDAAPGWLTPFFGVDTAPVEDLPGNPLDGMPGHGEGSDSSVGGYDIPGYAEDALEDDPSEGLTWAGKMAGDVITWAGRNPEEAVLITGGALAGGAGAAYLVTGSGVTVVGSGTASSLAAVGVHRKQVDAADEAIQDFFDSGDSSSGGDTDLSPGREPGHGSRGDEPAPSPSPPSDDDDPVSTQPVDPSPGSGSRGDIDDPDTPDFGDVDPPSPDPAPAPGNDDEDDGQHESIGRGARPGYGL